MSNVLNLKEFRESDVKLPELTLKQFLGLLGEHLVTKKKYDDLKKKYIKKSGEYSLLASNYVRATHRKGDIK